MNPGLPNVSQKSCSLIHQAHYSNFIDVYYFVSASEGSEALHTNADTRRRTRCSSKQKEQWPALKGRKAYVDSSLPCCVITLCDTFHLVSDQNATHFKSCACSNYVMTVGCDGCGQQLTVSCFPISFVFSACWFIGVQIQFIICKESNHRYKPLSTDGSVEN